MECKKEGEKRGSKREDEWMSEGWLNRWVKG
jgi:hypothetical protein